MTALATEKIDAALPVDLRWQPGDWPGARRHALRAAGRALAEVSPAAGSFARRLSTRLDLLPVPEAWALRDGVEEGASDLANLGDASLDPASRRRILRRLARLGLLEAHAAGAFARRRIVAETLRADRVEGSVCAEPIEASTLVDRATDFLRRAFAGEPFTLDVDPRGPRVSLDPDARRDLWDYLRAVAVDEPDRAAGALLRRLVATRGVFASRADAGELRTRFRQAAPFRDGGWSPAGDHLAEHVALHALWAHRAGFTFDEPSRDFLRAFFARTRLALRHDPALDPWGEALERLGWSALAAQGRRTLAPESLGRLAASNLSFFLALPGLVDHWLDRETREASTETAS